MNSDVDTLQLLQIVNGRNYLSDEDIAVVCI